MIQVRRLPTSIWRGSENRAAMSTMSRFASRRKHWTPPGKRCALKDWTFPARSNSGTGRRSYFLEDPDQHYIELTDQ